MAVRVQETDFDVGAELDRLTKGNKRIGGLAVFVGLVREMHVREGLHRERIDALTLEHYPGMTEKALQEIEAEAHRRWPLEASLIVHRYGRLEAGDRIYEGALRSCHEHDLPHEELDGREVARRFPAYRLPEDLPVLYQPDSGFVLPERCIVAHVQGALAHGATIRARERLPTRSHGSRGRSTALPPPGRRARAPARFAPRSGRA